MDKYSGEELAEALQIVSLSISRCEKSYPKFEKGTSHYTRLKKMIKAMCISKSLIIIEINRRG